MSVEKTNELAGQKIVIVGGGIGGASGALALALRGADVTLYERHYEFKEVGAGLQIGPHGVKMLEAWGLKEKALAGGFIPERMQFRDGITSEPILTMNFDEEFKERYGGEYLVIHRSDLLDMLVEEARKHGANLVNGSLVTGAEDHGDGVSVHLADFDTEKPYEDVECDMLIGFDGTHSIFRPLIVEDDPVPSAYVAYRGTSKLADDPDPEIQNLKDVRGHIGPRCHFIQYPLRGGELLNQVAVFQSPRYLESLVKGEEAPEDWGNNEEFKNAFDHTHDNVKTRLKNMWLHTWWQMADREPLEDWVASDRIIVMGDAAHPPLQYIASGAIMAMEDAETLALYAAEAAEKGELNWPDVLREVSNERQPRCARIQTTSRFWGELWHVDGLPRLIRNELFREAEKAGWYKYADWLWAYDPEERAYIKDPSKGQLPEELAEWEYNLHKIARQREEGSEDEITI